MLNDFSYRSDCFRDWIDRGYSPVKIDYLRFTGDFCEDDLIQQDLYQIPVQLQIFQDSFHNRFSFALNKHAFDGFKYCIYDDTYGAFFCWGSDTLNNLSHKFEIVLPGRACDALFMFSIFDGFCSYVADNQLKCTRLDISKDDFTGNVFQWWRALSPKEKCIRIQSKNFAPREWACKTDNAGEPLQDEKTYYLGNRGRSSILVRQYNKKYEQKISDIDYWDRLEFEIHSFSSKRAFADEFFTRLCKDDDSLEDIFEEIALQYFNLLEPNDIDVHDSNRSRSVKTDPSFLDFVEDRTDYTQKWSFAKSLQANSAQRSAEVYTHIIEYSLPFLLCDGFSSKQLSNFILTFAQAIHCDPDLRKKLRRYGYSDLDIFESPYGDFYIQGVPIKQPSASGDLPDDQIESSRERSSKVEFCERRISTL